MPDGVAVRVAPDATVFDDPYLALVPPRGAAVLHSEALNSASPWLERQHQALLPSPRTPKPLTASQPPRRRVLSTDVDGAVRCQRPSSPSRSTVTRSPADAARTRRATPS